MPFKKIYIEITNVCNLNCSFCADSGRTPEFMTPGRFLRALKALAPISGHIYPHVLGEPLLHPELAEILKICGEEGRYVNLVTNGRLLDEKAALLLGSRALRQVSVSLHSAEGGPPEAAGALAASILRFAEMRERETPYISLRLWRGSGDAASAAALDTIRERFPDMAPSPRSGHEAYRLAPGLFLDMAQPFKWPEAGRETGRRSCPALREQLAVLVDGTVAPCCLDARGELALGNVFETPINGILAGKRARAIREGFDKGEAAEALCRGCEGRP